MIRTKLQVIKCNTLNGLDGNERRIKAVDEIDNLISQIDHGAEIIPLENSKKLTQLLASLKPTPLTQDEMQVIYELINN